MTSPVLAQALSTRCEQVRVALEAAPRPAAVLHELYRQPYAHEDHGSYTNHLRSCSACRSWYEARVGEGAVSRARRMAKYCCFGLFLACEEPDAFNQRFPAFFKEQMRFSPSPGVGTRWVLGEHGCPVSYCPWCGTRLPAKAHASMPR